MHLKYLLLVSILLGACAVFMQLDALSDFRESTFVYLHQKLGSLLQTCPYHKVIDLLSSVGLAKKLSTETTTNTDDKTKQGVIRYEKDKLFTKEELAKYTGADDSLGLYLAILGLVYDVSKGSQYYAPGKGYGFFSGRDGTKAFMTGDFTDKGLIDEVTGLSLPQMLELENWIEFYDKTYIYKGKLIGNFYDENGSPTAALLEAKELIDQANIEKEDKEAHRRKFPPCNSSWKQDQGSWVSCSEKSGGIKRDWAGVPRKYHTPGQETPKCVCVRTAGPPYDSPDSTANRGELDNPHLEEYKGCEPTAISCKAS